MAILLIAFLTAATCSKNGDELVPSPFYGGIEGLTAEFEDIGTVSDTGPDNEVWFDETFPLEAHVINRGEYTIDSHLVEFEIKGISESDFNGIDFYRTNEERLDKVSEFLPDGGEIWVDFGDAKYMSLVGTHYDANIFLYFTYPYETYINLPSVCYKWDIKDNTVCTVDASKQAFASGGPLTVGTVEQRYIGRGKILLEIPISNAGQGRMKPYDNDEFKPNFDEFAFYIDDPDWDCSARGNPSIARISHPYGEPGNEEVIIRCVNENIEEGALYTRAVTLTLAYYYQDWEKQTVRILETPE